MAKGLTTKSYIYFWKLYVIQQISPSYVPNSSPFCIETDGIKLKSISLLAKITHKDQSTNQVYKENLQSRFPAIYMDATGSQWLDVNSMGGLYCVFLINF